jgi:hypothetical protein
VIIVSYNIPHVRNPTGDEFKSDEDRYNWQMSIRANYLLLGDTKAHVPVDIIKPPKMVLGSTLNWPRKDELIAGSFMSSIVQGSNVIHSDIDIYFKCKSDVDLFLSMNPKVRLMRPLPLDKEDKGQILAAHGNHTLNLIYGVPYADPADLISHFDIRACSIALDPSSNTVYAVVGALGDCCNKNIIYNPIPYNTTIARLLKYIHKGFTIDAYQRLFLSELIRSEQYNADLELSTGYVRR